MSEEPYPFNLAKWLGDELARTAKAAQKYLAEHPEEPGVTMVPFVVLDGVERELGPISFAREDFES